MYNILTELWLILTVGWMIKNRVHAVQPKSKHKQKTVNSEYYIRIMSVFLRYFGVSRRFLQVANGACSRQASRKPLINRPNLELLANVRFIDVTSLRYVWVLSQNDAIIMKCNLLSFINSSGFSDESFGPNKLRAAIKHVDYYVERFRRITAMNAAEVLDALKESTSIEPAQSLAVIQCFGELSIAFF